MFTCQHCGKPLILSGGKCVYCGKAPNELVSEKGNELSQSALPLVRTFKVHGVSFNMILVEGGTFWMGADDAPGSIASPIHQVTLNDFYIGETPVTQELWKMLICDNPSHYTRNHRPVEHVEFKIIDNEFLPKLCQETGMSFRLPTEAEWEYAARGGKRSKGYTYAGSDLPWEVGWYNDENEDEEGETGTQSVKLKKSNELGLYDMSGNVYELCSDLFCKGYPSEAQINPQGPSYTGSKSRVIRGGAWNMDEIECCVWARAEGYYNYIHDYDFIGFRLALSVANQ